MIHSLVLIWLFHASGVLKAASPGLEDPKSEEKSSLALAFEPNRGQADSVVQFLARGRGFLLYLSNAEARLLLTAGRMQSCIQCPPDSAGAWTARSGIQVEALRIRPLGAQPSPKARALDRLATQTNYLVGNDPRRWLRGIPSYARVLYEQVYPGIDMVYYGKGGRLEFDFIVSPGADPRLIRIESGGGGLALDSEGNLILKVSTGEVILRRPTVFQEVGGKKRRIAGDYVLQRSDLAGFQLGSYDRSIPLVIDPRLDYSTYLGVARTDRGEEIAVDSERNAYIVGHTFDPLFPATPTAARQGFGGATDVFVTKLDRTGTTRLYSTFIGGSSFELGMSIAVDESANAYITGRTDSMNFPTTTGVVQPAFRGGSSDHFVTKLSADGSRLVYSTYLGGSSDEESTFPGRIAVDSSGHAYIVGRTESSNFPLKYPLQAGSAGAEDGYIAKLAPDGRSFVFSTLIGGQNNDRPRGVALDSSLNIYVTGSTESANFPVPNALQPNLKGPGDAFVLKLKADGSRLEYSTFLGGGSGDGGQSIAVDPAGNAYVLGTTSSSDFPTARNPLQSQFKGASDLFVSKLTPQGDALIYSTYIGGSGQDLGRDLDLDRFGRAWVVGVTRSTDYFTTQNAPQPTFQGGFSDAIVTKVNLTGTDLVQSTYLGGTAADSARGVRLDELGNAYVVGTTQSTDFPSTSFALQTMFGGSQDAFATKIALPPGERTDELIEALEIVRIDLRERIDANPGSELADKLEDGLDGVEAAIQELEKEPPDRPAALGNLEGAAGDLEAALTDGLLDPSDAARLLDLTVSVARILALSAIDEAISADGDAIKIAEAEALISAGDAQASSGEFKSAIATYKDALSKAEGAF